MDKFLEFFKDIFAHEGGLGAMAGWQFILLIVFSAAALVLAYYILKYTFKFLKFFFTASHNVLSAKARCKKTQCPICGRTLDKCVCAKNQKRSYLSRLYHYKKDMKK